MSVLLALDPGLTTGWAVFDGHDLLETGNFSHEDMHLGLREVCIKYYPSECVLEIFPLNPTGILAKALREVVATIGQILKEYAIQPYEVTPGVWKTSSISESPKFWAGQRLSPHQRDAIRMGRYYLRGVPG